MMESLRLAWRSSWIIAHILAAFPLAIIFLPLKQGRHSSFQQSLIAWWLKGLCRILHVRLSVQGKPSGEATMLVANHISWLDIPVLASAWQGRFLSKADVAEWPVIGWLLRRTGTLLIRRGARRASEQAIADIARTLEDGESVCIFPEGTTTDGSRVLHFHPRLFQAACQTGHHVQPVMLRYPSGQGISKTVPFIGDDEFLPHLLQLLREPFIDVELVFMPCLNTAGHLPDRLAEFARAMIADTLDPQILTIDASATDSAPRPSGRRRDSGRVSKPHASPRESSPLN